MKKVFFTTWFAIVFFCSDAQKTEDTKIIDHYLGVQANELIRQLINLNTGNTLVNNPYLLTYSVFSSKYHWGLQAGFGYSYERIKDKLSPSNQDSKINDVFYRVGIARNFLLGKKWEATVGADYVYSYQLDKTFTLEVVDFGNSQTDSTTTISTSIIKSKGEGIQLRLGFRLTNHIMISTEATFYYLTSKAKNNVLVSENVTNTILPENDTFTLSSSNSDTENSNFTVTVPVAIFLNIKF